MPQHTLMPGDIIANPGFTPEFATEERLEETVTMLLELNRLVYTESGLTQEDEHTPFLTLRNNPSILGMLGNIIANYQNGKRLAAELGAGNDMPTALSFAYAIAVIGEEWTSVLYRNFGVRHFLRYPKEMLQEAYANAFQGARQQRPILLVLFGEHDTNGALYQEQDSLDRLLSQHPYRVILVETGSKQDFYEKIARVSRDYGRINSTIIVAHGPMIGSLLLGEVYEEEGVLDTSDEEEIAALRDAFVENPTVVMMACHGGEGENSMGAVFSRAWGAHLFAANGIPWVGVKEYYVEEEGGITWVDYAHTPTREFISGTPIQ